MAMDQDLESNVMDIAKLKDGDQLTQPPDNFDLQDESTTTTTTTGITNEVDEGRNDPIADDVPSIGPSDAITLATAFQPNPNDDDDVDGDTNQEEKDSNQDLIDIESSTSPLAEGACENKPKDSDVLQPENESQVNQLEEPSNLEVAVKSERGDDALGGPRLADETASPINEQLSKDDLAITDSPASAVARTDFTGTILLNTSSGVKLEDEGEKVVSTLPDGPSDPKSSDANAETFADRDDNDSIPIIVPPLQTGPDALEAATLSNKTEIAYEPETSDIEAQTAGGVVDISQDVGTNNAKQPEQEQLVAEQIELKSPTDSLEQPTDLSGGLGKKSSRKKLYTFCKCVFFPTVIVFCVFFMAYFLIYGVDGQLGKPASFYESGQVIPGNLLSLSKNGEFVVVRDSGDQMRVYDLSSSSSWKQMGQSLDVRGSAWVSANGTVLATLDSTTMAISVMEFDSNNNLWVRQNMSHLSANMLSLSADGTVLVAGNFTTATDGGTSNGTAQAYMYNGSYWNPLGQMIVLPGLNSALALSPNSDTILIVSFERDQSRLHIFRLYENPYVWEKLGRDIVLEGKILAIDVSYDNFVLSSNSTVEAFTYSGLRWGQQLAFPSLAAESVSLSLDGRSLVVISETSNVEAIQSYSFPSFNEYDKWEPAGPLLVPSNGKLFGNVVVLSGDASILAAQSISKGSEEVDFFAVNH